MFFKCKCQKPPFYYLDYEIVTLGENDQGEASVETCKSCGTVWLKFLIEEPHYSKSGRWWRAKVDPEEVSSLTIENVKFFIERQDECFAGGSYYKKGIHKKNKPIWVG